MNAPELGGSKGTKELSVACVLDVSERNKVDGQLSRPARDEFLLALRCFYDFELHYANLHIQH